MKLLQKEFWNLIFQIYVTTEIILVKRLTWKSNLKALLENLTWNFHLKTRLQIALTWYNLKFQSLANEGQIVGKSQGQIKKRRTYETSIEKNFAGNDLQWSAAKCPKLAECLNLPKVLNLVRRRRVVRSWVMFKCAANGFTDLRRCNPKA